MLLLASLTLLWMNGLAGEGDRQIPLTALTAAVRSYTLFPDGVSEVGVRQRLVQVSRWGVDRIRTCNSAHMAEALPVKLRLHGSADPRTMYYTLGVELGARLPVLALSPMLHAGCSSYGY